MLTEKAYGNFVETAITVFKVENSKVYILLTKKTTDPYKGYWILPSNYVANSETLENNITDVVIDIIGLPTLSIEQCGSFSNLKTEGDKRIITISYIGLVDYKTAELKMTKTDYENEWFEINNLPKLAFNQERIIDYAKDIFKTKIKNTKTLKIFFPIDFTLPELSHMFENLLEIDIDRRNFRKKLMNLEVLEDINGLSDSFGGRPAKLYKFKTNIEEKDLF